MQAIESIEVPGQGLFGDRPVRPADVVGKFTPLGRLPYSPSQRGEKTTNVTWVATRSERLNVDLRDLRDIVVQPVTRVVLVDVDQFRPPADDYPLDQALKAQTRTVGRRRFAGEQRREGHLAGRVS